MSDGQRTAIVTGAAGGIGSALVRGLLNAGIRVAASDRTAEGLQALAQSAREQGKEAALLTIEADLTRDDAVDKIVSAARQRFGAIDILVNNAGVGQATIRSDNRQNPIKFWEVTPEQWRLFVAVHTNAPMALRRFQLIPASLLVALNRRLRSARSREPLRMCGYAQVR